MFNTLYQMPNLQLFMLVSGFFVLISVLSISLIRFFVPLELRYKDNAVIGSISALISIIYGVLVGLTALYLINNVNYTSEAVQREANSAANVYRDSEWLTDPTRRNIQTAIQSYLRQVVDVEWPDMQKNKNMSKEGLAIIGKINDELSHYSPKTMSNSLVLRDLLEELRDLYNAREQRIHMSHFELNREMWLVILIGTVLTIAINFIFGINFYLHLLSVSAVALMASSMVFLLMTLERPFQGEFVVEPNALKAVSNLIEKKEVHF